MTVPSSAGSDGPRRPLVFVSYSHKDKKRLDELLPFLEVLKLDEDIEYWHDEQIGGGEDWYRDRRCRARRASRSCGDNQFAFEVLPLREDAATATTPGARQADDLPVIAGNSPGRSSAAQTLAAASR